LKGRGSRPNLVFAKSANWDFARRQTARERGGF
jgi:hypothetical protein